jgi:hypothetical protein
MENNRIREKLHESLLYLLWDQWVALGFEGHDNGKKIPFIIDPEALLLASMRFAMKEGRFGEAVSGWLHKNGEMISVQRLKNLQLATRLAPYGDLRELSDFMEAKGYKSWKALASLNSEDALEDISSDDFSPGMNRLTSQATDMKKAENLLLRMRLMFGISARPEILVWLLTHRSGHAAGIARETGWFSKSVQAILNDLEKAGMLVARNAGKRKEYSKSPRNKLWEALGVSGVRWFSQPAFYLGVHHVFQALEKSGKPGISAHARAITMRNDVVALESSFGNTEHAELFAGISIHTGADLIGHFNTEAQALLNLIETRESLGET